MADNVRLSAGTADGATVATDDDGIAQHQYVKLEFGADNTQTKVDASNPLPVTVTDSATRDLGKVDIAMGQVAHDAVGTSSDPVLTGGYASAAAPIDVSADGDAVRAWHLRNGAAATVITAAGALIGGDATNGLDVDVTRLPALAAGTNNIGDVDVLSVPAPLSTTGGGTEATALRVTIANDSTGVVSIDDNGGALTVDNGGIFAVQVDGAALTALQLIDNPILVDDAAFTPATSSVSMAGFQADETATDSVDEGDAGAARMTLDRKQIVTPQPHTAGGLSIFRSLDLDETEEDIKTSAGCIYGMWVTNLATTTRFIKFYNATAANVIVGTTTPVITIGIPGNTSDDVAGLFGSTHGIEFGTAISVAATTGVADADTGAPAANDVIINVFYK